MYPRDLHSELQGRWVSTPFCDGWPAVELPPKPVLDELLDVCFQASMLTDERRPTVFRVAYIASGSPVMPNRSELSPVTRYNLIAPVPFTEAELQRLAPVADPRRVLIAVEQAGERRQIYGLIDIGIAMWEKARHERNVAHPSPDALIVASSHPGELSISRGDRPVLRLRGGRIVTPTESVLLRGPVADFFDNAKDEFICNAWKQLGIDRAPAQDDGLAMAHVTFVESILLYTAELHHGGTLLFVPEEITHDDARLKGRVSIKYVLPSTRPKDALVSAMSARLQLNAAAKRLDVGRPIRPEHMAEWWPHCHALQRCEDVARDAARFIASLTAVDGAVVLTDMFRIIGFGAEVTANFSGTDKVHIAKDQEGRQTEEASFTEYGTRHRSAFRFAGSMESAVAFVMSQDGGVKALRQVGPRLLMWPYFQIGFTPALS
jgi:hypothetical protein